MASTITDTDDLQQPIESQSSNVSFASAPEIYGNTTFDFDKIVTAENLASEAENLASEAKKLINILKSTLPWNSREKFQIELRKINIRDDQCLIYKMSLHIDPILWFKYHAQNGSDVESLECLYENGRRYYDKVKNETEPYLNIKSEDEIKRLEFNSSSTEWCSVEQQGQTCHYRLCRGKHYEWCPDENYDSTGKCSYPKISGHTDYFHFSNFKKDLNSIYQCRYKSIKLNGRKEFCLFKSIPSCRIYAGTVEKPTHYPYFVVSARPDATPIITLFPIKHCSNEEYVETCDAWQAVLQTLWYMKDQLKLKKLPLNRIYVNFGKWMSQKAKDLTRRYCHAHINIVLTRETIDEINKRDQSKNNEWSVPSLVDSVLPTDTHRLDDALELIKYMNDHMPPTLFKDNQELKRTVSTLQNNLEKLERKFENLRQPIFGMRYSGKDIGKSADIIDKFYIRRGINDTIVMQESQEYSSHRWNRFLFPWNRT